MSAINVGEAFYTVARLRGPAFAHDFVRSLKSRVVSVPATDDVIMFAAALKAGHRISYADGFAAATAILHEAPLVTGDPELRAMAEREPRLKLDWIAE